MSDDARCPHCETPGMGEDCCGEAQARMEVRVLKAVVKRLRSDLRQAKLDAKTRAGLVRSVVGPPRGQSGARKPCP